MLKEMQISRNDFETALIFKGEELIKEIKGSTDSVHFTEEQTEQMKGFTLSHNHPNESLFSFEDLRFFIVNSLKEIRVVIPKGVYSLKRDKNCTFIDEILFLDSYRNFDKKIVDDVLNSVLELGIMRGLNPFDKRDEEFLLEVANETIRDFKYEWFKENSNLYNMIFKFEEF